MTPATQIVFWWLAFTATHISFSSLRYRPILVQRLGERGFLGVYSILAFATFIPLCNVYFSHVHDGPLLHSLATIPGVREVALVMSWVFFAAGIGGLIQPSALSMVPGGGSEARGMGRITRHPMFMSFGVWAAAHTLVNAYLTDVLFFGGFALFTVVGCAHQDARKRVTEGKRLEAYFASTSLFPFAAILAGRNRLVLGELPWAGIGAGVALATVIYLYHSSLFGSSV
jgi:uncharacterized membrane protein